MADNDTAALTRLPGIGKKTAERIIIELRDKLDVIPAAGVSAQGRCAGCCGQCACSEAITRAVSLGYKPQEVQRHGQEVAEPECGAEDIIRLALQSKVKP